MKYILEVYALYGDELIKEVELTKEEFEKVLGCDSYGCYPVVAYVEKIQ